MGNTYPKHPATWLNDECWDDDRAAWQRSDSDNGLAKESFEDVFNRLHKEPM